VLKSHGGEVFLSHFVNDIASNPQSAEGILATDLLVGSFSPPLLMWLNEIATPKEKAVFANFATEVRKISLTKPASAGERMQECWDKVFAARDSVKEIQLKVEKNVKAMQKDMEKAVGLDKPAPDKPKLGLGTLLRKSTSALEASRKVLLRQNATEQLLKELLDESNCEGVVLIPIERMIDGQDVPKMLFTSSIYGDDPDKDAKRMKETTGWECNEGTPAGLCKNSRAVVNVKNLIADSRFPELSYKVLGATAICQLSQLVIPVFQGGGADNDAEDDSIGSNIIAIIKLVNKVSFNGDKSGLPFEKRDEIVGRVYAALITEALTDSYGTDQGDGGGFMGKLQIAMNNEKARKLLSSAGEEQKAATVMQASYRGRLQREGKTANGTKLESV